MSYRQTIGARVYRFDNLAALLARASPARSGDLLAGVAAESAEERMAARLCLADVPLSRFLQEALIPYEDDEVTRLIIDTHGAPVIDPVWQLLETAYEHFGVFPTLLERDENIPPLAEVLDEVRVIRDLQRRHAAPVHARLSA